MAPLELAKQTWNKSLEHELLTRASCAAYYALTAFVPFLAVVMTIAVHLAPQVGDGEESGPISGRDQFAALATRLLPREASQVIVTEISRMRTNPPIGFLSVGLVVSVWLSCSFAAAIIDAMNRIHEVIETRSYPALMLAAIGLTMLQAMIILGTVMALVVWPQVSASIAVAPPRIWDELIRWFVVAVGVCLSIAATLHFGPNLRSRRRWITPGCLIGTTVVLFSGLGLRLYVHFAGSYGNTYGSLGGIMLLSFWFWIVSIVLLLSSQIDRILEEHKRLSTT
jgi:membrane protein